jgi:hypothetical protein
MTRKWTGDERASDQNLLSQNSVRIINYFIQCLSLCCFITRTKSNASNFSVTVKFREAKSFTEYPMVQSLYSFASRLCPLASLEDGAKFLKVKASARDDLKLLSCKMPPKYSKALIGKSIYYSIVNV